MAKIGVRVLEAAIQQCEVLLKQNRDRLDAEYCAIKGGKEFKPKLMLSFRQTSEGIAVDVKLKIPQKDLEYKTTRIANENQLTFDDMDLSK